MNQFLIATHYTLAEGFAEAVRFFNRDISNVDYLNCYVDSAEVETEMRDKIKSYGDCNLIVMTDIAGGSVNQIAARLMKEYSFHLITGLNLPLLLELSFKTGDLNVEDIHLAVKTSRDQISYINELPVSSVEEDTEEL